MKMRMTSFGAPIGEWRYIRKEQADKLEEEVIAIDNLVNDTVREARHIKESGEFSAKGKAVKLKQLGQQFMNKLDSLSKERMWDNWAEHAEQLTNELEAMQPKQVDPILRELRGQEIRRWFNAESDNLMRRELIREAIQTDNDEFIDALKSSPVPVPDLRDPEVASMLREFADKQIERRDPEKAELRQSILNVVRELKFTKNSAARFLREKHNIPIESDDPIAELAAVGPTTSEIEQSK